MKTFIEILNEARQKLPLKVLMERRGRGPSNGNWKSFPKCPYCEGKGKAGVFSTAHGDRFKCHRSGCPSGTADGTAWDEIGFLAHELKCDRRIATRRWLEEAGLWEQRFKRSLRSAVTDKGPVVAKPLSEATEPDDESDDQASGADDAASKLPGKSPLVTFYEGLSLSIADREELKIKRGLTDEIIDASGFRTNCKANREILLALAESYDESELVRIGLWSSREKVNKPSGQFYGCGVVGKKKKLSPEQLESRDYSELEDDEFAWAWKESGLCNPILIPYYNLNRELIALRPHKGFARGQRPRLYLAGGIKAPMRCKRVVIVEGEFKAAALQSMLGINWAVASVPGITQVKNLDVWEDILHWLKTLGAREVVIAFDNEEQGDPALPSFRPLLEDRFEAEVWARVCAVRLDHEGYRAKVAQLPDEWRNAAGKADWDSALASLRKSGKSHDEIAALFETVLKGAQTVGELAKAKLFGTEAENSIRNRVEVRIYEPELPWGGEAERRLVKYLRDLAKRLPAHRARILALVQAYEDVFGWYYEFKLSELQREKLQAHLQAAENFEVMQFFKLALKGTPSRVAAFRLIPCYVLVKPDGTRERLVKLRNIRGECSGLVALDSKSFTAPRDFRLWLADQGNYDWGGGERSLQALQRDTSFKLAHRTVQQLICYGCERPGRLWVLDDCAFASDGVQILPDRDGVFWHGEKGYKLLRDVHGVPQGEEKQSFKMATARMRPEDGLVSDSTGKLCLQPKSADDPEAIRELLGGLVTSLNESYGGHDGSLLVGSTLAFYAAPELFQTFGQFPGIWITGEKGSGKTCTAKFLMALHGFSEIETGISFKSSTAVGMQIALGQCANIPVWGDEYKETELWNSQIKGIIHSGFNREQPSKWSADGASRTIRTNLIITGETTCANVATMSRFVSVTAAREKRTGTSEQRAQRLEWLRQHQPLFFAIGRAVARRRTHFAKRLMEVLADWERFPDFAEIDPRTRFTYGVSYASLLVVNEIIPIFHAGRCDDFRQWMINKAKEGDREIAARVDINQAWTDLLSAFKAGVFGGTNTEVGRFFKTGLKKNAAPCLAPQQLRDAGEHPHFQWKSRILYFTPGPVIDAVRRYKNSQGQPFVLDQHDLHTLLKTRPYFVPPPPKGHQKKFGKGAKTNSYCWAIDLDLFPTLGVNSVTDAEWDQSKHHDEDTSAGLLPADQWVDPRKGELFTIIDALEEKAD